MTFVEVLKNEYITNDGPQIEIVLGADIAKQTVFAERPYYIPAPPPVATATGDEFSDMILVPKKKPQATAESGSTGSLPSTSTLRTPESSLPSDETASPQVIVVPPQPNASGVQA